MTATIIGIPETLARMAQVVAAGMVAGEVAVEATTSYVADTMRGMVAVDTGETLESIEETPDGVVVGGAWPYLEFGTHKMAAEPFIRPSADSAASFDVATPARVAFNGVL